jgi:hypothetical protein
MILGFAVAPRRVICRTGDMAIGMTAQKGKELENLAGPWIHNARECRVGDYLVDAPDRQGSPELFVSRTGLPVLALSKDLTTLVGADGHRVLYEWDRKQPGFISYNAFDRAHNAWVENVDFGADGVIDFRRTEVADQPLKEQVKVGDRWLDYVTREGRSGVVLDGKFMSPAAARKEVAARGNAIE